MWSVLPECYHRPMNKFKKDKIMNDKLIEALYNNVKTRKDLIEVIEYLHSMVLDSNIAIDDNSDEPDKALEPLLRDCSDALDALD